MSYRNNNSRRERSRESSPNYNRQPHDDYRNKPRDVISPSEFQRRIDPGVPKSKHSVQIKGLPSNIRSYEVEDFLQKRVGGPLKTIYFKPDIKNDETVIAIRFEDKEKAKICVDSLHKTIMLGSKIFIDYYQDFNRHNEYIGLT
jgi:RNA recognition motif-containing protein